MATTQTQIAELKFKLKRARKKAEMYKRLNDDYVHILDDYKSQIDYLTVLIKAYKHAAKDTRTDLNEAQNKYRDSISKAVKNERYCHTDAA